MCALPILKIYGQMLRVPVHVVQDAQELRRIVQGIAPEQTILIGNVGIRQRDRYISEQAAMLARSGRRVKRLLVLKAPSHGDTLAQVVPKGVGVGQRVAVRVALGGRQISKKKKNEQ